MLSEESDEVWFAANAYRALRLRPSGESDPLGKQTEWYIVDRQDGAITTFCVGETFPCGDNDRELASLRSKIGRAGRGARQPKMPPYLAEMVLK
jgi:hypothetical protein